jgi:uncharacterized protein YkwD
MRFFPEYPSYIALAVCLLSGVLCPVVSALTPDESKRASGLFAVYREAMKEGNREAAEDAIGDMISELPGTAAAVAHKQILSEAQALARDYTRDAQALLAHADAGKAVRDPEVVQDRKLIGEIYAVSDEAEQKKRLAEEGWPAMERLRAKLLPAPGSALESDAVLIQLRDAILFRLDLCDDLAEHANLPPAEDLRKQLNVSSGESAGLMSIATAKDRRVLTANRKIEESGDVPEKDVIGVEDSNRLRMLAGLPALSLDPNLCKAALMHSEDMFKHKFFDHKSPVEGRREFTDRAREAGASASAENIAQGQQDAADANKAWFLSPGHFRNFFGSSFTRIGYGTDNGYYTQLFGN